MNGLVLIVIFTVCTTSVFLLNVTDDDSRIVNGNRAYIQNHQHLVALYYGDGFNCGGSLISNQHVLTAVHCVHEDPRPRMYMIGAGSSRLFEGDHFRQVTRIWMHPKYNPVTTDYDVAVLKLFRPVEGKWIKPIALPTTQIAVGTRVNVAGWGSTDRNGTVYPSWMRAVFMKVIDKNTCSELIGAEITSRMLCAINYGGKGFCFGDSGGALTKDGVIYGVISFSRVCGSKIFPSGTANVMYLKGFINSKLKL